MCHTSLNSKKSSSFFNTPHSVVSNFCFFECLLYGEHIKGVDNNNIFGAGTRTATMQVQKAAGITVDGLAGAQTIRACYVLACLLYTSGSEVSFKNVGASSYVFTAKDPYDSAEDCIWGGLQAVVYEPGSAMS